MKSSTDLKIYNSSSADELLELKDIDEGCANKSFYRVALLIPMCGSAGIWAPSCIASAQVAVSQVNQRGGIAGKSIRLLMVDAAEEADIPIEQVVNELIQDGAIDAIVGMHISAVRQKLSKIVCQRIPYVYTPLYEGGETTLGIFAIGDTPAMQLGPAIETLTAMYGVQSWALMGNNYVWPHASNFYAKKKIEQIGGRVCYENYLDFGAENMHTYIEQMAQSGADVVLMSLVGQDAIAFNRAFGALSMHDRMIRLSCAMEENELLASGVENLSNLFSSSSYFSVIDSAENRSFKEVYYQRHGEHAPTLNTIGQSTYEGIQFLASLLEKYPQDWMKMGSESISKIKFFSVRRHYSEAENASSMPVYLAKAEGHNFKIVKKIHD